MNWMVVVVGMLVLPPFVAPNERERAEALGDVSAMSAEWRRVLEAEPAHFPPVPEPGDGDWLARRQELGQTFLEFARSARNVPVPGRRTLYLLPLDSGLALDDAAVVLSRFLRLRVKVLEPMLAESLGAPWREGSRGGRQIFVVGLADALRAHVPTDALGLIAVTEHDLYRHGENTFTYGYARPLERVGVVGVHRFADDEPLVARRRFLATLFHEAAHQLGIRHCIYYACLMNGSSHLAESDARPLHLCPVCLRKLSACTRFSPLERYRDLELSLRKRGLAADARWFARRVAHLAQGD